MNTFYDQDAGVLYISFGQPAPAITIDLGNGVLARYDPASGKIVGFTLYGL